MDLSVWPANVIGPTLVIGLMIFIALIVEDTDKRRNGLRGPVFKHCPKCGFETERQTYTERYDSETGKPAVIRAYYACTLQSQGLGGHYYRQVS